MFRKWQHNMSAVYRIYDADSSAVVTVPSISNVLRSHLSKMVTFLWGDIISQMAKQTKKKKKMDINFYASN